MVDVPDGICRGHQHTCTNNGPIEGVEGKGRIRIATVFANEAGFAVITSCKMRWKYCAATTPQ